TSLYTLSLHDALPIYYPADPWTFTDVTGNYNNASGTVHDHIDKASSTTVLTFETGPYVYRSSAFTATAQVTGVGGLNQSVTAVRSEEHTSELQSPCNL